MTADSAPSETLIAAITTVVDDHVDQIRAKARDDIADELDTVGYSEAAQHLRAFR